MIDHALSIGCSYILGSIIYSFFKLFIYLFIYFWLHWVFVAVHGLSLVAASGGYCLLRCVGCSLQWLLLLWSTGSRHVGFSSCGTQAQQLWCTGLVAPRHVGSSHTRVEPVSPALAGGFLTTAPPGKSSIIYSYTKENSLTDWYW